MILISITKLGITWSSTDIDCCNLSEQAEYQKMIMDIGIEKLVSDIEYCINLIESIENSIRRDINKFSIIGEDISDEFDLYLYKENLDKDKPTLLFYEFLISRKEKAVESLSKLLGKAKINNISVQWDESTIKLIDTKWYINSGYKLGNYIAQ